MALENHVFSPFGANSGLIRPNSDQSDLKFDFWLNFTIKTRKKFN